MRYFIITSGSKKGLKFIMPDDWDSRLTIHEIQEITAEQYADEFEGEE